MGRTHQKTSNLKNRKWFLTIIILFMWSYEKKQTKILDVETWYNKFANEYKKHHKFLNEFDKDLWKRFIPNKLDWKIILDLWC